VKVKILNDRPNAEIRYRLHDGALPGKPDLVFPKYEAVMFGDN